MILHVTTQQKIIFCKNYILKCINSFIFTFPEKMLDVNLRCDEILVPIEIEPTSKKAYRVSV